MKTALITLMALAGVASANTLLSLNFTTVSDVPEGWTTGQWNGDNTPHYTFGENGAVVNYPWKQNFIETSLDITSMGAYDITYTLYNNDENTGNMFYLSSDSYSIIIGNSYTSNSEVYVGTLDSAVGAGFVCFQTGTGTNPTVLANSEGFNVSGNITYTLTLNGGNLELSAVSTSGSSWTTSLTGLTDVTFNKVGFINDGSTGCVGVKNISIVPEPATATLSLLALASLAARRRRR